MGLVRLRTILAHRHPEESVDPQQVALQATLDDIRRVSSELHATNAALSARVTKLKEKRSE